MYVLLIFLLRSLSTSALPMDCHAQQNSLELGKWKNTLHHLDNKIVDYGPTSSFDGQAYVYENEFPDGIIEYVNVENLVGVGVGCGAKAIISSGGVGKNFLVVTLYADRLSHMRNVIDVWGRKSTSLNDDLKRNGK